MPASHIRKLRGKQTERHVRASCIFDTNFSESHRLRAVNGPTFPESHPLAYNKEAFLKRIPNHCFQNFLPNPCQFQVWPFPDISRCQRKVFRPTPRSRIRPSDVPQSGWLTKMSKGCMCLVISPIKQLSSHIRKDDTILSVSKMLGAKGRSAVKNWGKVKKG